MSIDLLLLRCRLLSPAELDDGDLRLFPPLPLDTDRRRSLLLLSLVLAVLAGGEIFLLERSGDPRLGDLLRTFSDLIGLLDRPPRPGDDPLALFLVRSLLELEEVDRGRAAFFPTEPTTLSGEPREGL